jgi:hypothetical protein
LRITASPSESPEVISTILSLPRPSVTAVRSIPSPVRTAQKYWPRFSITAATGTTYTLVTAAAAASCCNQILCCARNSYCTSTAA